jgi:hypothetical protein
VSGDAGIDPAVHWSIRIGAAALSVVLFGVAVFLTRWFMIGAPGDPETGLGIIAGMVALGSGFGGVNLLRVVVTGDRDGLSVIREVALDYQDLLTRASRTIDDAERANLSERVLPGSRP